MAADRTEQTWTGGCRSRWAWPLAGGFAAAGLVAAGVAVSSGQGVAWFVAGVMVIAAVAVVAFTKVRVTVDGRGLRIEYGPVGWPVSTVALDDIAVAELEPDAVPTQWGGWGYRGSRRVLGRAAVVLRRGPAIRLELRSGATFLVTVDDAAAGANLLHHLVSAGSR